MPSARRGPRGPASALAGVMLAASACASSPPPAPTRPLSVGGVFDCALSVMAAGGWQVAPPPGGPPIQGGEAEGLGAALQRGDSPLHQLVLAVWRTDRGAIALKVVPTNQRPTVEGHQLELQIVARCLS